MISVVNVIEPSKRLATHNNCEYHVFSRTTADPEQVGKWVGLSSPYYVLMDPESYWSLRGERIEWVFDDDKLLQSVEIHPKVKPEESPTIGEPKESPTIEELNVELGELVEPEESPTNGETGKSKGPEELAEPRELTESLSSVVEKTIPPQEKRTSPPAVEVEEEEMVEGPPSPPSESERATPSPVEVEEEEMTEEPPSPQSSEEATQERATPVEVEEMTEEPPTVASEEERVTVKVDEVEIEGIEEERASPSGVEVKGDNVRPALASLASLASLALK